MNRRTFLTRTAAAGAGLSLGLPALARHAAPFAHAAGALAMGAHLTPILLVDDALRIILFEPSISADLKAALIDHQAFARSSSVLTTEEDAVLTLLASIREGWAGRDQMEVYRHQVRGDMLEPKLAVAAAWLAHRAAHAALYGGEPVSGSDDRALYHDVTLLHALHQSEPVDPASSAPSVDALARLIEMMYLRAYMRMHTIDPDFDDVEAWILRVVAWNRDLEPLARRYAEAYLHPDPAKLRQYVEAPGFYEPSDPIIQLARSLQQGLAETPASLEEAVAAAPAQSQYAQALARAFHAFKATGAFLEGRLGDADLRAALG